MRPPFISLILAAWLALLAVPAGAVRDLPKSESQFVEAGQDLPPGHGSVAAGRSLYAAQCAVCHGAEEEDPEDAAAPAPRGGGAQRWSAATVLFDAVHRRMPQDRPGSLSPNETYALVAYILHRNGLLPANAVLDAASLPRVRMSAGPHFVSPRLAANGSPLNTAD